MREKLHEYALIAEIVSAIAVVASLIFVGVGIRQNSEQMSINSNALQIGAYQDLVTKIIEVNQLLASNYDLAELNRKGNEDPGSLTATERNRYTALYRVYMRHAVLAYVQYQQGIIDESLLRSALNPFRARLQYDLDMEIWANSQDSENSDVYPEGFYQYMNSMMRDFAPEQPALD